MPKIAVVTGPTATGKTRLGILLAQALNGEIVGADSMQIYRYMNIGTAKPTPEEMQGVPHHMVDCVSPFEAYSVSRYVEDASRCVDDILRRGRLPIVVGGTGLYIDSLLAGRTFAPEGVSDGLRAELGQAYDRRGGEAMLRELAACDPESAARLHPNDRKRILRALEIYRATGRTKSAADAATRAAKPRYEACRIALTFADRQTLYARIDRRVDEMIRRGLEDEVRRLLAMGLGPEHTAMQAIGYKEMAEALRGGCTVGEAAERIKLASRHYAKRQLSWLGRDSGVRWLRWENPPDFASGVRLSTEFLENTGILESSGRPAPQGGALPNL